ncbi:hypothetical protein [Sphingomonas sp. CARO-RG-8B-R24-01]|uniref:hypothetical protein n=1 Tax=Sphingomonas sp. CARO-RG-8B-R24-01 TaxID=2914831 RepID=UPI001F5A85CB|nr:hypothetical protein [Sphingomonas sp. CARO-RG-8B-R24-01]
MKPVEYVFRIDVFQPETMPMARLAEYMAALAKMFGHTEHTHFVGVEKGSAKLRTAVDPVDAPKVEARLNGVRIGDAPKDAIAGKLALEDLLANDNAVATLTEGDTDRVVIPFIGRNRPKALTFPPFREDTSIDGVLVKIGGKDPSAHATLQDGDLFHVGVTMRREIARELAPLLYGPTVRMFGNGRFERLADGVWRMSDFRVDRYERLDERPIGEALAVMRAVPGNRLMDADSYRDVAAMRNEDGAVE